MARRRIIDYSKRYFIGVFKLNEHDNYEYIGLYSRIYKQPRSSEIVYICPAHGLYLNNSGSFKHCFGKTFLKEEEAFDKIKELEERTKKTLRKDYFKSDLPIYRFKIIEVKGVL